MGLFSSFRKNKNVTQQDLPWQNLPPIFTHIQSNMDAQGRILEAGHTLPDEKRIYKDGDLKWAAGALDGAFGHHGNSGHAKKDAKKVAVLIKLISQDNSLHSKVELYHFLLKDTLMDFIDPALETIIDSNISVQPYLQQYARWLAYESPDRGPVKFGIALLGILRDRTDVDKLVILGKHDEFTLFSAVALTNILEDAQEQLWELAKHVDGWGKIQIVERLTETQHPQIKQWLLREGYKNSIMYEYLAYTCAVAGDLKSGLSQANVDRELLDGATDIIQALLNGGPAQDIHDYADAAEVIGLYVSHLKARADQLNQFLVLHSIKAFLENEEIDWNAKQGWSEGVKANILIDLHPMLSDVKWKHIVLEKQHSANKLEFWQLDQAATILGIDLWETHWKRVNEQPLQSDLWYTLMKHANQERIDGVIGLALEKLPLDKIATGPADQLGIGEEYSLHQCLDFLLQDLGAYPQKGMELIQLGLKSPVTRNRNMAIKALSAWGTENWPKGMRELLKQAEAIEPNTDTKKTLEDYLQEKTWSKAHFFKFEMIRK